MVVCPSCHRHVFAREVRCPFCDAPVTIAKEAATPPRMSRAAYLAWNLAVGTAACAGPSVKSAETVAVTNDAGPTEPPEKDLNLGDGGTALPDYTGVPEDPDAAPPPEQPRHVVPIYGAAIVILAPKVLFLPRSDKLGKEAETLLDEVANVLKGRPDLVVSIQGHTSKDEPGAVGDARAKRVAAALVKRGIAKERLFTMSWGNSRPIDTDAAHNRRVDFHILDGSTDGGAPVK